MIAKQMCEFKYLVKPDDDEELDRYIENLMVMDLTRFVTYDKTVKVVDAIE